MNSSKTNRSALWAKTTRDGHVGISVFEHMLNVGCVARCIAAAAPDLLDSFRLETSLVGGLAALHDLGKISPGFQMKCEEWLRQNGLSEIAQKWNWGEVMESDHGKVTHAAIQKYFIENNVDEGTSTFLPAVLGGHHGRLNPPNERGFKPRKTIVEQQSGIDWEGERTKAAREILSHFRIDPSKLLLDDSSPALWWLAGLTSVADWIGSDERYFPPEGGMDVLRANQAAAKCIQDIGFDPPQITSGLSFQNLFHFEPNAMQSAALSSITDRGVYVIEAPMGMGKTEAALGAAYQLLADGKASGIYFALPTQATSNRMHLRMKEFVERIAPNAVGSKIIHSTSWLMDKHPILSPAHTTNSNEDATIGRDWYSSAKRALIAPFGVGTVDQALLGIVAAKHFFVRHFALAGKVVILDEIHSYDLYTGTLIDRLIEALEKLGCTVIVLSATLSKARRGEIISISKTRSTSASKEAYPLISGRRNGKVVKPIAVLSAKPKTVHVDFKSGTQAVALSIQAATKGACVVWVCDTVNSAQQVFLQLKKRNNIGFPVGLLHAHFPFWRREELEDEWMTRLGKEGTTRCGSILVSTQIVEQSVDLDADVMITELAPTDMLLQRMGRLWRHERGKRPVSKSRLYIIEEQKSLGEFRKMEAREIAGELGNKARVYDPYVLLRSLQEWKKLKKVTIPTDVRKLIEATYKKRGGEPRAWQRLFDDRFATESGKKFLADRNTNLWQVAIDDEEGRQTRLNEILTLSLVLCHSLSDEKAEFIDGKSCVLGTEEFQLTTAQAIHRNLARIPDYHFVTERTETHSSISRYLRGKYVIGRVASDGTVSAKGVKDALTLRWDLDLGLAIEKRKA